MQPAARSRREGGGKTSRFSRPAVEGALSVRARLGSGRVCPPAAGEGGGVCLGEGRGRTLGLGEGCVLVLEGGGVSRFAGEEVSLGGAGKGEGCVLGGCWEEEGCA